MLYRALALQLQRDGVRADDAARVLTAAQQFRAELQCDGRPQLFLDGEDISEAIASPTIVPMASTIAAIPAVRTALRQIQQKAGETGGVVMEGRDVATVLFPDAEWKFFITAEFSVRLQRMYRLLTPEERRRFPTVESYAPELRWIDEQDGHRSEAPVKPSPDAIIYDNSHQPPDTAKG
jgi:cytidylate kinase